jgi:hypothetical protein
MKYKYCLLSIFVMGSFTITASNYKVMIIDNQ